MTFSYILPVHNQETVLEQSVGRLVERLRSIPGSEVILVENGSSDGSAWLCRRLAERHVRGAAVPVLATASPTGLGHALRRGMAKATAQVVVLTAADLPFGFSDLDAFLRCSPEPAVAIGSKAHPQTTADITARRRLMSTGFRALRRALLHLDVGDSQGTIFIRRELAQRLLPALRCGGFLISTEVIAWAASLGEVPVELPVVYPRSVSSTVAPLRDSLRMLGGTVALRSRLRSGALAE